MSTCRLCVAGWLLATAAVLSVQARPACAAETLTMKFKEGETYGYLIKQEMTVEGQAQGKNVRSEMGQTLTISTIIKSVAEDGSARAAQTIDRVQMKVVLAAPVSKTIEYDTAATEEPTDPTLQQIATNLSKMVGEAILMTISPQGEMSDVVIPEKIKESQQSPGAAAGGSAQLEQMFQQSGIRLPKGEISVGHTWDQKMEMKLPFGTMVVVTSYTYKGKNDDGLHKIDAEMDVDLQPAENAPVKMTAESKEAHGAFLFDNQAGRLHSSDIKQVLEMDLGGIAKQNITTVVTMTPTDGSTESSAPKPD